MRKTFIAIAALLASSPAFAVDLTMTFKDPETGKLIPDVLAQNARTAKCEDQEGGPCLTLGAVLVHSLLRPDPNDNNGTDPVKREAGYLRGAIAYRILDKKAANFGPKELPMVQDAVSRIYSPAIQFLTFQALGIKNPSEEPGK